MPSPVHVQPHTRAPPHVPCTMHRFNFHVPAATQGWHFAFHSCNGFHELKNVKKYKGVQPLWWVPEGCLWVAGGVGWLGAVGVASVAWRDSAWLARGVVGMVGVVCAATVVVA